jgi:microcystin-dependent protein
MPSTYSTRLRFELQATGENSNTWGVINNTNIGTLIEQAIAGVGAISMPDADYTLTATDGAADEARSAVLVLSGSLTSGRNLVIPAVQKLYLVRNETGRTVTVKTSGGAGVAVGGGFSALVFCDGTDCYRGSLPVADSTVLSDTPGSGGFMPVGSVTAFAGASAPSGWLLCYGQAVSRTGYAALFAVLGTTYGSGDGSSTFNLPDLRGRVTAGVDNMGGTAASRLSSATAAGWSGGAAAHSLTESELPSHTHAASTDSQGAHTHAATTDAQGAHSHTLAQQVLTEGGTGITGGPTAWGGAYPTTDVQGAHFHTITVASGGAHTHSVTVGAAGGGGSHNNVQPTLALNYIIKT